MRSSELAALEAARAAERPRRRRVVHRDVKPAKVRDLRSEVEQAFRDAGAKVFREEVR